MNNVINKIVLAGSLALLLGACHHAEPPASAPVPAASARAPGSASVAASASAYVPDNPDEMTPPRSAAQLLAQMLHKALANPARSKADKAFDADRHPGRTLAFFGLRPDMDVIEVDPGKGWYAAILAPLLAQNGTYTAAVISPLASKQAAANRQALHKLFKTDPGRFGRAQLASFDPHTPNLGTPGSADMVVSFRDVHQWIAAGTAKAMFKAVADVLKPGGVFGVVEYRASADMEAAKPSPYVSRASLVKLATQAGLKLDDSSDVNANPEESGSAVPPPTEGDRMTLRFSKPATPAPAASA